jgi:tetratricopeptide (TPR) repeat protein
MLDQDSPNYGIPAKMLKKLITADPPPSPRQLAAAQLANALMISRVTKAMSGLGEAAQKELSEATGVSQDADKAKAELTKAESVGIDMARIEPDLYLIKARRLRNDGQTDQALALIQEAIKADPNRAYFYIELARVMMEKPGGEKDAADALLKAIKTMGESPKLLVMLGDAYRKQGKTDDAISQYQRAVADPKAKNPEARVALGLLYKEKKDLQKAQESLEKAAQEQLGQGTKLAITQTELGRVMEEKGDRAKADEWFKKALGSDPDYADVYYLYGKFLKGDPKTAAAGRTSIQEYLKKDPKGRYAEEARSGG